MCLKNVFFIYSMRIIISPSVRLQYELPTYDSNIKPILRAIINLTTQWNFKRQQKKTNLDVLSLHKKKMRI